MALRGKKRSSKKSARARRQKQVGLADVIDLPAPSSKSSPAPDDREVGVALPQLVLHPAKLTQKSPAMGREVKVATYNVHRWTGMNGRSSPDPARAGFVISELDADIIGLQEVLIPFSREDPLKALCAALGLHYAFAATRLHKRGEQGNAILSRFPIESCSVLDISHSRIEKRGILSAEFEGKHSSLCVMATHLSLVDRTRQRQVSSLLRHPHMHSGPAILLGDMNAWRQCKATKRLDDELARHHNAAWPSSFPAARPTFALDRVYAQNAKILAVKSHDTPASRRASDHLPVVASIRLDDPAE